MDRRGRVGKNKITGNNQTSQSSTRARVLFQKGERIVSGFIFSLALITSWSGEVDLESYHHFAFCLIGVWVILFSLIQPLMPINAKLSKSVAQTLLLIAQATQLILVVIFCPSIAIIGALVVPLIGVANLEVSLVKLIFCIAWISAVKTRASSKVGSVLSCVDFIMSLVSLWISNSEKNLQSPTLQPAKSPGVEIAEGEKKGTSKGTVRFEMTKNEDEEKGQLNKPKSGPKGLFEPIPQKTVIVEPPKLDSVSLTPTLVKNSVETTLETTKRTVGVQVDLNYKSGMGMHTVSVMDMPQQTNSTLVGKTLLQTKLPTLGMQELNKSDKLGSFLLNESYHVGEAIKIHIFTEYFNMMEELLLVADSKLNIIANNYSYKLYEKVVKKLHKRFIMTNLQQTDKELSLQDMFEELPNDSLQCGEETINYLISVYQTFDFANTKVSRAEYYRRKKIDQILNLIENLETGVKISKRQEESHTMKTNKKVTGLRSSVRAINLSGNSLNRCETSIPEILRLLKEYLGRLQDKSGKCQFPKEMQFIFFFKENVQLRIRVISLEEKYYLFLAFENIVDKVALGEINSKLNYSLLLLKSLSHELFTPVHQLLYLSEKYIRKIESQISPAAGLGDGTPSNQYGTAALPDKSFEDLLAKVKDGMVSVKYIVMGLNIFVHNMLDFANILNNKFVLQKKRFKVKDCFDHLLSIFMPKAKQKKIKLSSEVDPYLEIYTDFDRMVGLLYNFIDNSVKLTQKGFVTMKANQEGKRIVFRIIDTGIGIEEKDLLKISEILKNPFVAEVVQNSAGLCIGMRVSQAFIQKLTHGDLTLDINTEKNRGTTIKFELMQGIDKTEPHLKVSPGITGRSRSEIVMNIHEQDQENSRVLEFLQERQMMNPVVKHPQLIDAGSNRLSLMNSIKSLKAEIRSNRLFKEGEDPLLQQQNSAEEKGMESFNNSDEVVARVEKMKDADSRAVGMQDYSPDQNMLTDSYQQSENVADKSMDMFNPNDELVAERLRQRSSRKNMISLSIKHKDEAKGENESDNSSNEEEFAFGEVNGHSPIEKAVSVPSPIKKLALVVDDDPMNGEIAQDILSILGLEVQTATSGEVAIEFVYQCMLTNRRIDIIILDYNMPEMRGDEVAEILRKDKFITILQNVPFIGLTAQTDIDTREKCLAAGMNKVVNKPINVEQMRQILKDFNI